MLILFDYKNKKKLKLYYNLSYNIYLIYVKIIKKRLKKNN